MNMQGMMQAIGVAKRPAPKAVVLSPEKAKALLTNAAIQIKVDTNLSFDKTLIMNQSVKMADLAGKIPAQKAGSKPHESHGFFGLGSVFSSAKPTTNKH